VSIRILEKFSDKVGISLWLKKENMAQKKIIPASVEDILARGGMTGFHKKVVLVTGLAWTFVSMEILLIAFTLPLFASIWKLSGLWLGLIGSASLIGSFIGSMILGRWSDRFGRRSVFMGSVLWYSIFTAATAFATGPETLFVFRVLAGIGLGAMLVIDPSVLAEYLPPQNRGRYMVFLDFFWPIGNLLALGLSYFFLERMNGDWRGLFLTAAFPAFLTFIIRFLIPETPFYLARIGKLAEAAKVLTLATGQKITAAMIKKEEVFKSAPIKDLFRGKLLKATIVTLISWVVLNFSYYGLFIWLPQVLPVIQNFRIGNIYTLLLLSVLAQFPGYLAAMWLVEAWGRKKTLTAFLILGGLSGLVFATTNSYVSFLTALFLVSFFNLGAWGAIYPYTVELFPTLLRGTAFGFAAEGMGKLTAIFGPLVFGYLLDKTGGVGISLVMVAAVMTVGGVAVGYLGPETKGRKLE